MWLKKSLLCLFLVFYAPSVATCTEYVITEQQLTRLETNLITLKSNNSKLQADLKTLKEQSMSQEELLKSANQSFDKFAASQKAKLRRTKAERNILLVALTGFVVTMAVKK